MKISILLMAALLALGGMVSLAKDKHSTILSVRAVGYRAIPHERTSYIRTEGYSNTSCYGNASDVGMWTNLNLNCSTVSTPPTVQPVTIRSIEVYNFVEANGMGYTIRCTAHWIGSSCSWLTPGDSFPAEVKGTTMWIVGHKGGNMGKEMRTKFALLDMRPIQPSQPLDRASLPNFHDLTNALPVAATRPPSPAPTPTVTNGLVEFTFTSTPANAVVSIGGMAIGRTPFTVKLPPGYYKATFAVVGYANSIEDITVGSGYPTTVNTTLKAGGN
jgi:hypothetical protein